LDLAALAQLNFEAPDQIRFPALGLAREALRAGGGAPAVLNAANEVAVDAFLTHRIAFLDIAAVVEEVLSALSGAGGIANSPSSLAEVEAIDRQARLAAQKAAAARLAA
jgi:1-deoxy-D-xylulose-5-phosphate reductoisomerase